jgi:hypothetical protein
VNQLLGDAQVQKHSAGGHAHGGPEAARECAGLTERPLQRDARLAMCAERVGTKVVDGA